MVPHAVAEQDEIVLINLLKALFNSVRSSALHVRDDVHAVPDANVVFLIERIRLCTKSVASLKKIDTVVKKTVVHSLESFKKTLACVSARVWQKLFEETVVQPFERSLLKVHSTKEGKIWVKTCIVIFRK